MENRMKFASFTHQGRAAWGAVTDAGVIDLSARHRCQMANLARGDRGRRAWRRSADLAASASPDFAVSEIAYEIPIPSPEKILCVGVNFPDRNAEYKDGKENPPFMSLFPRFARSFTGHDQPLIRPPESPQLDYEGEVTIVIGKGGRRIAEADALDHIAALTLCNEGTIRDWVRHAKFNVTQGKNWDRSGSIGPWIVPFTDESQLADIALQTRVNGEVRQSGSHQPDDVRLPPDHRLYLDLHHAGARRCHRLRHPHRGRRAL